LGSFAATPTGISAAAESVRNTAAFGGSGVWTFRYVSHLID
jgi:hypothetical protein